MTSLQLESHYCQAMQMSIPSYLGIKPNPVVLVQVANRRTFYNRPNASFCKYKSIDSYTFQTNLLCLMKAFNRT